MGTLRTPESEAKYKKLVAQGLLSEGCALCDAKSIKDFRNWKIINNTFPYDRIAEIHHMIVLKRHAPDSQLTAIEKEELSAIKDDYLHKTYEYMIEATYKKKSIPEHDHLHLIVAKD